MLRNVVAVVAGLFVMVVMVFAIQWLGHSIYPPPPGIDPGNHEAMIALIPTMPVMALGMVLVAYAVGSLAGAYTASSISLRHKRGVAITIGLVMLGLVATLFWKIPHPQWMVIAGLAIPLPCALLGWLWSR